jgi:hypothetical protein
MVKILNKIILVSCTYFMINSCSRQTNSHFNDLIIEVGVQEIPNQTNYVILIPGQGCSGCLQAARKFMKANYKDERFMFILTKYDSFNQLKILYGTEVLEYSVLDKSDIFYNSGYNTMYPAIVSVKNGDFKIRLADPDHYALWEDILVE